jgi:hypothetical protein
MIEQRMIKVSVEVRGGSARFRVSVQAENIRPGATYTVQFFSNPPGTGEGRTCLGQKTGLNVDGSGHASFTFSPAGKVAVGQTITATATNEFTGDTSEFSAPKGVVAG